MFWCCSLETSHPRLLPQSLKDCSIHLCLFFCSAYRVIINIFLNSIYLCSLLRLQMQHISDQTHYFLPSHSLQCTQRPMILCFPFLKWTIIFPLIIIKNPLVFFFSWLLSALMLSHFSSIEFCVTLWTIVCQAALSMGFSRQEYLSGFPCTRDSRGFPGGKESACNARATGDVGSVPGLGRYLGMATHSSILSWRIPWTEEPGGLRWSMGSQRVWHD